MTPSGGIRERGTLVVNHISQLTRKLEQWESPGACVPYVRLLPECRSEAERVFEFTNAPVPVCLSKPDYGPAREVNRFACQLDDERPLIICELD